MDWFGCRQQRNDLLQKDRLLIRRLLKVSTKASRVLKVGESGDCPHLEERKPYII